MNPTPWQLKKENNRQKGKKIMKITRKTTESQISVALTPPPLAADYRSKINTPITFLNHMIEHIAWRSGVNIDVEVKMDKFEMAHLICEDAGITMGKVITDYLAESKGVGYGDGIGIIDEAMAVAAVSFESRARFDFSSEVKIPERAEDMASEDLQVFLDGITQGGMFTLHVNVKKGENSHHIWEAVFRAVGIALSRAFAPDPARPEMTAGVAGKVEFIRE